MLWIRLIVLFLLMAFSPSLLAQGYGSSNQKQHRDFAGKPCLQTSGISRPLASNPRILDHAVSLDNRCFERIKAKVCYYNTDECTDVEVPPHGHKEQIIGVFPAMQVFRYDVREQF